MLKYFCKSRQRFNKQLNIFIIVYIQDNEIGAVNHRLPNESHSHSSKYKQRMSHKKYKQKEVALYRLQDIKL